MPQWLTIRADAPRGEGMAWMRSSARGVVTDPAPWGGMKTTIEGAGLRFMTLDVYRVGKEIAVRATRLGVRDPELRDQLTRAAKSLLLNLSEGLPSRSEPMRRRYFASAKGSAYEVAAAVDVAAALGHCPEEEAAQLLTLCDRVSAMLYRMK